MRIFIGIGSTEAQLAPAYLLKKSIINFYNHKNNNIEFIFNFLHETEEFKSLFKFNNLKMGTAFSLQRFVVQKIAYSNNCKLAIYLDSDVICLKSFHLIIEKIIDNKTIDILIPRSNPFFNQPIQTAIFFMQVNKRMVDFFESHLNKFLNNKINYKDLISNFYLSLNYQFISHNYNSRDYYNKYSYFLHFTDLWTQPWVCFFRFERRLWIEYHKKTYMIDSVYKSIVDRGIDKNYYLSSLSNKNFYNCFADIFFVPPQIDLYLKRYRITKIVPSFIFGFLIFFVGLFRGLFKIRAT
jgi:hypothetical protein